MNDNLNNKLDRIQSHVESAHNTLKSGGTIGKIGGGMPGYDAN